MFPAKRRIISPESSVSSVRRQLQLFARRKSSFKNTIFEMSSGLHLATRLFGRPWHSPVLTLQYFGISVTVSVNDNCTLQIASTGTGTSSPVLFFSAVIQFYFNLYSSQMRNATALRCTAPTISDCQFVFSFPLHFVFNTHTHTPNLSTSNFSCKFDPPRPKDACPILSEISAISPAAI